MNGCIDLEVLLEQKDDKTIDRLYSQIVKNRRLKMNELKKLEKQYCELEKKCFDIFSVTTEDIYRLEVIKKKIKKIK